MNLQYISDANGMTTGVFIPIEEWDALVEKYKGIEAELDVPEWHKAIVAESLEEYKKNPGLAQDFDEAMDELDKGL